ncbi:unnamed protein product [Aphanomyces euteiches]|uniref:Uncharacterized protein n=1 Tax=Aphanomyces euteiches TaxID=100861 RepID=A0A6G0X9T6_9STRA|nr:hypothetical protein Ae201684_006987 [Aphanomyces euteiches]KAH9133373.1 hypothetical protein AeRB84_020508 [Aphanomyces euteiches]
MDDASDEEEFIEPVYLDLEGRELYLVKLPKELGYSWNTISDSEVVLGTLKMNKRDASGNRKGLLSVNPATLSEEIPLDYRTVLAPSALPLKVFSQDGSGRMAIEGKVTESCTLMPQPGALYKKQLGERYIKSMQKGTVVPLESTPKQVKGGITLKIPKPRESDDEEEDDGKFISKDLQNKKIKMDRDALKNVIFKQFEKRDFWPLKELNLHCHQPEAYLKEILKEICVYHKRGPNKSCYELQSHLKSAQSG